MNIHAFVPIVFIHDAKIKQEVCKFLHSQT